MLLFGVARERNWELLNTGIVVVVDRVIKKDVLTLVPFNVGRCWCHGGVGAIIRKSALL